jgi:hypothetical protein
MPSRHPGLSGVAGGRLFQSSGRIVGREKFAFSIAEVTDALALEVSSASRRESAPRERLPEMLRCI